MINISFKKSLFVCLIISIAAFAAHQNNPPKAQRNLHMPKIAPIVTKVKHSAPRITIWIHGTKSMGKLSDYVHATPQLGMAHASTLPCIYRIKGVIEALSTQDAAQFPAEHFYTYGWSGKLGFDTREQEAETLLKALQTLRVQYTKKHDIEPEFTLITHSHGGNVMLNLAMVKTAADDLVIHRAIVLACPVQHETKHLAADNMFKQVYAFYSDADVIQILDPQGLYKTAKNSERHLEFSERRFAHTANLKQAHVKMHKKGVGHLGFILCDFIECLPALLAEIDVWELEQPNIDGHEKIIAIHK